MLLKRRKLLRLLPFCLSPQMRPLASLVRQDRDTACPGGMQPAMPVSVRDIAAWRREVRILAGARSGE